jgi:transposase
MRIALEVGTHSPWVSRLLKELGHEVLVANPRKTRLIYQNRGKQDSVDAEALARIARLDPKLLYPVEHRPESVAQDLAVLRARDALVPAESVMTESRCGAAGPGTSHRSEERPSAGPLSGPAQ